YSSSLFAQMQLHKPTSVLYLDTRQSLHEGVEPQITPAPFRTWRLGLLLCVKTTYAQGKVSIPAMR
ncbi:MAG TPA: hypothetical protein VIS10_07855, partial [Anaerolineales bacterium]